MLAGGPFDIGPLELLLILVVVIAVFGASKIADLGGALGKSVREFRKAVKDDDDAPQSVSTNSTSNNASTAVPPPATTARFCTNCGSQLTAEAKFCAQCGAPTPATVS